MPARTAAEIEAAIAANLPAAKVTWCRQQLQTWAAKHLRAFPWRQTRDPYAVFIAESLLQKTDAAKVLPVYRQVLARYPEVTALAAAPVADVAPLLRPLGLYFRAERLCQAARAIVQHHGGRLPDREAALERLPGIGRYTARAICAQAFDQPAAVLDTNVARLLERCFGLRGDRVKSRCKLLWRAAECLAPPGSARIWNLTLLDFGAVVCTARQPRCGDCPLRPQCNYVQSKRHSRG